MEKIKVHVILQSWKSDTFMYSCHRYAEFFNDFFLDIDNLGSFKIGLE